MARTPNRLKIKGLRQRWMINTIMPILVVLILAVCILALGISRYYHTGMRSGMEARARAATLFFHDYPISSYSEYYQLACNYASEFEDKDKMELQFINTSGRIQVSSYGLTAGISPGTPDIMQAISEGAMKYYEGADPQTGENIMAVSSPVTYNGRTIGVLRYVTSLKLVTKEIVVSFAACLVIAMACLALIAFANMMFINNVVRPVAEVSDAAKRIAGGSYGVQVENKYSDELGELVENINAMSLQISQNEKMKTEFISSVSHELRTPLTAISGWGETILGDTGGDVYQTRRGMSIILKEARRLTGMVEELLEFSKMENGRFTLRLEPVDLQAEFEDTIFTYRELFQQEGIEVHYEANDELYDPISADPERLKQVFCNILDNAAKHGGEGKRIDASVVKEGESLVIRIRDYGPGIPEEELPYVKQKFYKGSSKARGSGIGLAVCDEIIRLHDGIFDIGNAEGGGTIVTIRLPAGK